MDDTEINRRSLHDKTHKLQHFYSVKSDNILYYVIIHKVYLVNNLGFRESFRECIYCSSHIGTKYLKQTCF